MEVDDFENRPRYEPGVNKGYESESDEWDEEETEPIKEWDMKRIVDSKIREHNRQSQRTGERPENMVITVDPNARPRDSSVQECDSWFNFVPETEDQAWCLMTEATNEQAGALARVKNLIRQLDVNKDLFMIKGMATLKRQWRNPGKRAMKSGATAGPSTAGGSGPSAATRGSETADKTEDSTTKGQAVLPQAAATTAVEEALPPVAKPKPTASAEEWWEYFKQCRNPEDVPVYLLRDAAGVPSFSDVRGHAIMERTVPHDASPYYAVCYRRQFATLFAIPGLYEALVKHSGTQPKPEEQWRMTFPEDLETVKLDVPTVAIWLRENGLTDSEAHYLERIGARVRQDLDNKTKSRQDTWLMHPLTLKQALKKYKIDEEEETNATTKPNTRATRSAKGKEKMRDERSGSAKPTREPEPTRATLPEDDSVSLE